MASWDISDTSILFIRRSNEFDPIHCSNILQNISFFQYFPFYKVGKNDIIAL